MAERHVKCRAEGLDDMKHEYADINGIRMHYVTHGSGEPILLLHGFPEYWGVWKKLLADLSKDYRVIAPDLRGYNLTSQPRGVENYRIELLVADVRALADHLGLRQLTLVCQDWGALLGWSFALRHPDYVRRFVTINMTHPALLNRDLRENPRQQQASQYMLGFRTPGSAEAIKDKDFAFPRQFLFGVARQHGAQLSDEDIAEWIEGWKRHPDALDAQLNYYRATELGPPDGKGSPGGSNLLDGVPEAQWKTRFPVLVLMATEDPYLLEDGFKGLEQLVPELTFQKIPGASHWVALEKPDVIIRHLRDFIAQKR
jgi:pimeloyl-ACP methyl ester carboxylesterase